MPTCTLCSWCTAHTLPHNSHVLVRNPLCTNTDEKHPPKKPPACTCTTTDDETTHDPNCPVHR